MAPFPLIQVRHPRPGDLVDIPVQVAGVGTGFEGRLGARVRDHAGNVLTETHFDVGGTGISGNFALILHLDGGPATSRGAVEVFDSSARDGSDVNLQVVPITFAPFLLDPYHGFALHTVAAGESLSEIAKEFYGDGGRSRVLFEANRDVLDDPDEIRVGQVLRISQ